MDARCAGVIDFARGNRHLPAADVINLRGGKDARCAGVIDFAMGEDLQGRRILLFIDAY